MHSESSAGGPLCDASWGIVLGVPLFGSEVGQSGGGGLEISPVVGISGPKFAC